MRAKAMASVRWAGRLASALSVCSGLGSHALRAGEGRANAMGAMGGWSASGHALHQLAGQLRSTTPMMAMGAHHILRPALAGCVPHPLKRPHAPLHPHQC